MTINSTAHTVIGVMPEEFRFQRDPELILPAAIRTQHGQPGNIRLPGYCAAQARRHDCAGQRRSGSHVGDLVARLASAAGIRSRGVSGCSLRTQDPAAEAGNRGRRRNGALGRDGYAGAGSPDRLRERGEFVPRARGDPPAGTRDPSRVGRRLEANRAGDARRMHDARSARRRPGSGACVRGTADPGRKRSGHAAAVERNPNRSVGAGVRPRCICCSRARSSASYRS